MRLTRPDMRESLHHNTQLCLPVLSHPHRLRLRQVILLYLFLVFIFMCYTGFFYVRRCLNLIPHFFSNVCIHEFCNINVILYTEHGPTVMVICYYIKKQK
ncbi:hypothetical protein Leryth_026131, partial [Lithospermum erythrorhizon]